ncbi:endoplasmic reticulum mannosyl-oligosaccharide 1,2-alpha-mannosidase [Osmia bicornis bicornis]|uniref:endoplasmic reticulum mannosyl-oligosaccharide 1,2-alpha-mannosidase n=1 Tax=Osmia bicornis bicornis TaxID=1437191 RepID=UPI0010F73DB0|nr:endoplasmic reticulum mannosyl-oligosaccharide 1,2-alpha-mannosidase [Osmia bicornis bicornis]XP_046143524.1 endoplasmic reticulum mannosyl-oligosaccharide 1,2-alpha-mannosidase [Osmia bicornis bicornis]
MFPSKDLGKTDYISLNIQESATFARGTSRSLWRQWNQLSRFQRNILYFVVITIILVIFYLLPGDNKNGVLDESDYSNIEVVQDTLKYEKAIEDIVVDNANQEHKGGGEVIEEPEFQPEINQVDDDQIGEPPQPKPNPLRFNGPQNSRQRAVVAAFKHSWNGYKEYAWGHDNVKPISRKYHEWFGLGLTIVDSLDTLYIMGLNNEFLEARTWVDKNLVFTSNRDVNLFEVTIRVLGGLLSAYHLSGDKIFLNKATSLGERMMPAFLTSSGVPFSDVNLGTKTAHSPKWGPDSSTSEVTSIQLEFRDLSRSTGDPKYEEAAAKVSEHVHQLEKLDGLVPIFINANTGLFREHATITLGARGDSYYEYLLKQWLQTGKTINYLRDDYLLGIFGTQKHLVKHTAINKYLFIAELVGASKEIRPKMDHLTCYLGGTLALGVHHGLPSDHMDLANELVKTCYQTYAIQPTFLAPEITYFNIQKVDGENSMDMYVKINDAHNLLRPEFIESLFYMWYFTGNKTFQDWGWQIFQAFENYTKVEKGYTSIGNVRNVDNTRQQDMTESFWFGETLKYLYLLFDDTRQLIDLDRWVFNSEGHPLPIYES